MVSPGFRLYPSDHIKRRALSYFQSKPVTIRWANVFLLFFSILLMLFIHFLWNPLSYLLNLSRRFHTNQGGFLRHIQLMREFLFSVLFSSNNLQFVVCELIRWLPTLFFSYVKIVTLEFFKTLETLYVLPRACSP